MLETCILETATDAEAMRREWSELAAEAPKAELTLTPTWLLAWWHQFGGTDGRSLRLVTFRDAGKLVAIAPLCRRLATHLHVLPVRRLELLATGDEGPDEICSDYVGLLCADGYGREVASTLARLIVVEGALGPWDELRMPNMSGEDPMVEELRAALAQVGAHAAVTEVGRSPYVALPGSWDEYLRSLHGQDRYLVTRAERELQKWAGRDEVRLMRASTPEELAEGKRILQTLHQERWQERGDDGVFASARFTRFHDEVMSELLTGNEGKLDLLWLTVKGEPVAAVYNLVFRGKVYFYQSGRKLDVPKGVKPGISIHAFALRRAIDEHLREYDFLNGLSQYKRKLATGTHALVSLRAFAPNLRARAVEAASKLGEAAVEQRRAWRKSHPPAPAETSEHAEL
ncbi:MAG TPA: GNAT family N-acetyltransferase [Polyangiaceae bacterium]|jgi:CelD/BcsL family acetyltransferase involved in cellulose biosynthesis